MTSKHTTARIGGLLAAATFALAACSSGGGSTATVAPSMASESMPAESMAPESMAPESMAPESMAPSAGMMDVPFGAGCATVPASGSGHSRPS